MPRCPIFKRTPPRTIRVADDDGRRRKRSGSACGSSRVLTIGRLSVVSGRPQASMKSRALTELEVDSFDSGLLAGRTFPAPQKSLPRHECKTVISERGEARERNRATDVVFSWVP